MRIGSYTALALPLLASSAVAVRVKLDTIAASATGAMFRLTLNEHFATHLDAPRHAAGTGWTNEQIPLTRLVAPVVVIDVTAESARDRDYDLSALPRVGAFLVALPITTRGGAGGPVRVLALIAR